MVSNEVKNLLKRNAILDYGCIFPLNEEKDFSNAFTEEIIEKNGKIVYHAILFWFNIFLVDSATDFTTKIKKIKII